MDSYALMIARGHLWLKIIIQDVRTKHESLVHDLQEAVNVLHQTALEIERGAHPGLDALRSAHRISNEAMSVRLGARRAAQVSNTYAACEQVVHQALLLEAKKVATTEQGFVNRLEQVGEYFLTDADRVVAEVPSLTQPDYQEMQDYFGRLAVVRCTLAKRMRVAVNAILDCDDDDPVSVERAIELAVAATFEEARLLPDTLLLLDVYAKQPLMGYSDKGRLVIDTKPKKKKKQTNEVAAQTPADLSTSPTAPARAQTAGAASSAVHGRRKGSAPLKDTSSSKPGSKHGVTVPPFSPLITIRQPPPAPPKYRPPPPQVASPSTLAARYHHSDDPVLSRSTSASGFFQLPAIARRTGPGTVSNGVFLPQSH